MLPKKKIFFKYIKSSKKNSNADLIIKLADYFSCSLGEAEEYSTLLKKEDVENILSRLGVNEKESKKLVKDLE
jgi:Fe-S cluster assembly scaffold protein SufB